MGERPKLIALAHAIFAIPYLALAVVFLATGRPGLAAWVAFLTAWLVVLAVAWWRRGVATGRASRRAFGVRTWLILRAVDFLLRFADPRVRAEVERGMRLARQPFTVEFNPAVRAATEVGVSVCPAHGGWFEVGCMGICDRAPRGVASCPLPGGAS